MDGRRGWSLGRVCGCAHTSNPAELAFPLGPLLEAAATMATEYLPTFSQSTSSTYARTNAACAVVPSGTCPILILWVDAGRLIQRVKLISF